MLRNIKLVLEFEGTNFLGWQRQASGRTVQAELEKALWKLFEEKIKVVGQGRTDRGAHALGFVANFKTSSKLSIQNIKLGLNSYLPRDLLVKEAQEVSSDFHSRFQARSRTYQYKIFSGKTSLYRNFTWPYSYRLDLEKLKKATQVLLGENDFSSFCVAKSKRENNKCQVYKATWRKQGNILIFEITANRFLHSMVRILVGTLLEVGRGGLTPEDFFHILQAKDRRKAKKTAPAFGLYLVKVNY